MPFTIAESKELMLKYLDEYSTDGEIIAQAENQDYLLKHNVFANKVQFELARQFKMPAEYKITQTAIDPEPKFVKFTMPADFMDIDKVVYVSKEGYYINNGVYNWENDKTIVLPYDIEGTYTIHYWKYPTKITNSTLDTYEYELKDEIAQLIPMKVAALIIPIEKRALSTRLLNLYEGEKNQLDKKPAELKTVQSVFYM